MIDIPPDFAASTIAREGDAGERWIAMLPARVEALCRRWRLTIVGAPMHGYVAVVVPVARDGARFALKVSWIDDSSRDEAIALRVWDGRGAARVIEADAGEGAMLLEWLDPRRSLMALPPDEAAAIAGALLRRLWVTGPAALRSVAEEVSEVGATLRARWEAAGCPGQERSIAWAAGWGAEPACAEAESDRIVNQDLHFENVLAGQREPWLVIDPKPLRGPAEFGVAPLLWNRAGALRSSADVDRRVHIVCEAGGLNLRLARAWSRWRLVEAGIWASEQGDREFATRALRLAERLDPAAP